MVAQDLGRDFERAVDLRARDDELAKMLRASDSLVIPVWRNRNLIAAGRPARPGVLRAGAATSLFEHGGAVVFLGLMGGKPCFALDVAPEEEALKDDALAGQGEFNDLRLVGSLLAHKDAELLAYARGMLHWHRHHRFCPRCGEETRSKEGGHTRLCLNCDKRHFPRTDPAIMTLVVQGDSCLLARQAAFPEGMYSVLAGFVEPGESLEGAVVREVREEVGLEVSGVSYFRSQPWPFPSSLMIGFSAMASERALKLDHKELEAANWFTREQIRSSPDIFVPPPFSLANQLITHFLNDDSVDSSS